MREVTGSAWRWALGVFVALLVGVALISPFGDPNLPTGRIAFIVPVLFGLMLGPVLSSFAVVDRWPRIGLALPTILVLVVGWALVLRPVIVWLGFRQSVMQDIINVGVVVGVMLAIRGAWRGIRARRALEEAERLRELAEQRAFQAQLSPHALHNLLNTLYAASLASPGRVPELVLALSGMMRYLALSAGRDLVTASDEWAFMEGCRRFALERSSPDSRVDMVLEGDADEAVPSLLMASLLENALKNGRDTEGRIDVVVHLAIEVSTLRFRVDNAVPSSPPAEPGMGLGHSLVRRRLAHLYPGRHRFEAGMRDGRYVAELDLW